MSPRLAGVEREAGSCGAGCRFEPDEAGLTSCGFRCRTPFCSAGTLKLSMDVLEGLREAVVEELGAAGGAVDHIFAVRRVVVQVQRVAEYLARLGLPALMRRRQLMRRPRHRTERIRAGRRSGLLCGLPSRVLVAHRSFYIYFISDPHSLTDCSPAADFLLPSSKLHCTSAMPTPPKTPQPLPPPLPRTPIPGSFQTQAPQEGSPLPHWQPQSQCQ